MWHTVPVSGYTTPILETMLEEVTASHFVNFRFLL